MSQSRKEVVCDNCGFQKARTQKITRTYGKGASLLIIENIPVVSCSNCGETLLGPDTVRAIERIKRRRKSVSQLRSVPVARLE